MNIFKKIFFLLTDKQKKELFILIFLLLIGMLFEMIGIGILIPALRLMINPEILKNYQFFNSFSNYFHSYSTQNIILFGLSILLLVNILKTIFIIFLGWRQSRFSITVSSELSQKLFSGYLQKEYSFHLNKNSSEILHNVQSEIQQFNSVLQLTISLITELSILFSVAIILFLVAPLPSVAITIFLTFTSFIYFTLTKKKLLKWGQERLEYSIKSNQILLEGISGVKEVKVFGVENYFINNYTKYSKLNSNIIERVNTLANVPRPFLELLSITGLIGLIAYILLQNNGLETLIPTVGVFVAGAFRIIPSVNKILNSLQTIKYTIPSVENLYLEMNSIFFLQKEAKAKINITFDNELSIQNLTFNYPKTTLATLKSISLKIKKGETIGIIGESGSGKSTLIDLILGLLPLKNGKVFSDENNIEDNLISWRNKIGYVPQTIFLTDSTIKRNIAFGIDSNSIDDELIKNSIVASQLLDFVETLEKGVDTEIGERGVRISGGQRQRIGIARALYHNPPILILDEATSALDLETETEVMKAIYNLHGSKTIIIVTHRISTLDKCDTIYKIKDGEIKEYKNEK